MQLSKKWIIFPDFSFPSLKSILIFEKFEKKMTLIVYVFSKKQTAREVVRQMRKKPRFRTPVDSQHVKEAKTLVKSTLEYLHQISSSLWAKLTWKMSLLVISELVGHFAFADFAANIRMTFIAYVFKQYGLQKMWLDKCLKSFVSEHHSTVNILKGRKQLWNLHDSTFIKFLHQYEQNWLGKCLSQLFVKS